MFLGSDDVVVQYQQMVSRLLSNGEVICVLSDEDYKILKIIIDEKNTELAAKRKSDEEAAEKTAAAAALTQHNILHPKTVKAGDTLYLPIPGGLYVYPNGGVIRGKYPGVPDGYVFSIAPSAPIKVVPDDFVASCLNKWFVENPSLY